MARYRPQNLTVIITFDLQVESMAPSFGVARVDVERGVSGVSVERGDDGVGVSEMRGDPVRPLVS